MRFYIRPRSFPWIINFCRGCSAIIHSPRGILLRMIAWGDAFFIQILVIARLLTGWYERKRIFFVNWVSRDWKINTWSFRFRICAFCHDHRFHVTSFTNGAMFLSSARARRIYSLRYVHVDLIINRRSGWERKESFPVRNHRYEIY